MRRLTTAAAAATILVALLPVFALLGCEGNSLFFEIDNDDISVVLETIADGSIVSGEISVSIATQRSNDATAENGTAAEAVSGEGGEGGVGEARGPGVASEPVVLDWVVRATDRPRVVSRGSWEITEAAESTTLRLPEDLSTGLYELELTVSVDGREIEHLEREFFYSSGSYRFARVSSYPAAFVPNSDGILIGRIKHPEDQSPFVRVHFAGQSRTAEVEDGRFEVMLHSPESEGVYTAQFELFPVKPPADRAEYRFEGPVTHNHKLIVKDRPGAELADGDPRFSRFALRGNLRDSGVRPRLATESAEHASEIGSPRLAVRDEVFGYWLESGEGFELSDFMLPVRGGAVEPFTIELEIYLPTEQDNRHVFSTVSKGDDAIGLAVLTAEEGRMMISIWSGERSVQLETQERMFETGAASQVRVIVIPRSDDTLVRLSERRAARVEEFVAELSAEEWRMGTTRDATTEADEAGSDARKVAPGKTVVGGVNGFCGIIESFSAYSGDRGADELTRRVVY